MPSRLHPPPDIETMRGKGRSKEKENRIKTTHGADDHCPTIEISPPILSLPSPVAMECQQDISFAALRVQITHPLLFFPLSRTYLQNIYFLALKIPVKSDSAGKETCFAATTRVDRLKSFTLVSPGLSNLFLIDSHCPTLDIYFSAGVQTGVQPDHLRSRNCEAFF
ncbi:uncharacterized protein CIMG_13089 [Coccidioides immitis RS]|uniref:Uncharacterized protein n=1 Tax=Coccidioides immitis (strain RS) TaxID=246410 RepID=A0A0D8JTN1_COCIM|nr:uncharacterized protein CIMG_13089 [Coccidioides immitis RS]KJF60637.1 hypothetical protein CIMG_13089 [Coccidioides immitis RS]